VAADRELIQWPILLASPVASVSVPARRPIKLLFKLLFKLLYLKPFAALIDAVGGIGAE
jgi:hypothetical protein